MLILSLEEIKPEDKVALPYILEKYTAVSVYFYSAAIEN